LSAGAYIAHADLLAVFRGPTSKGRGVERKGGRKLVLCPMEKKEKSAPMAAVIDLCAI